MLIKSLHIHRKYPQFQQQDIFSLADAFRKLDVEDRGYLDEGAAVKAVQASEKQPYDVVRQALKEVELDSSRRVELDDYVDVCQFTQEPLGLLLTSIARRQDPRSFASPTGNVHRSNPLQRS